MALADMPHSTHTSCIRTVLCACTLAVALLPLLCVPEHSPAEPLQDEGCAVAIERQRSGYCECERPARTVGRVSCTHATFTCADICHTHLKVEVEGGRKPKEVEMVETRVQLRAMGSETERVKVMATQ